MLYFCIGYKGQIKNCKSCQEIGLLTVFLIAKKYIYLLFMYTLIFFCLKKSSNLS